MYNIFSTKVLQESELMIYVIQINHLVLETKVGVVVLNIFKTNPWKVELISSQTNSMYVIRIWLIIEEIYTEEV